jgi:hypothetical protein
VGVRSHAGDKVVPKQRVNVTPIRPDIIAPKAREVADIAFNLWLARAFRGGSPEEDLLRAVNEVRRKPSVGLFLLPRRKAPGSAVYPFPVRGVIGKG